MLNRGWSTDSSRNSSISYSIVENYDDEDDDEEEKEKNVVEADDEENGGIIVRHDQNDASYPDMADVVLGVCIYLPQRIDSIAYYTLYYSIISSPPPKKILLSVVITDTIKIESRSKRNPGYAPTSTNTSSTS
jgi:hypothetical protein